MRFRNIARAVAALAAVAALGACASIPQRAWSNGQAMSSSLAYQKAMSGDMSLDTHRRLKAGANPLRLRHREVAYPAFGEWWW
jgi:hypothetical protein